jgi:hypothetical protein
MFRRRLLSTIAMIVLVTGVLGGGPARAQAPLGFTIAPTQGLPGDTVTGQVNVADVTASCVTDLAAFQARFTDLLNGPFVGGNTEGELPQTWFPDPNNIVYENTNQLAYVLTLLVVFGISNDIGGAAGTALPQTFVMTFPDIATQQPVGELGHFDPATGAGSLVVPDVAPGPWAVAAACVGPSFDLNVIRAGVEASGAFLTGINVQFGPDGPFSPEFVQFMRDFLGPDAPADDFELLIAFVGEIGPTLLQPIVTPDALGVQIFTVLTQPQTKNDCKNGGWKNFPGLGFTNQGQCIAFVNTGQRPTTTTTAPTTTTTTTTSTTTTTMGSPSGAFLEDAANPLD